MLRTIRINLYDFITILYGSGKDGILEKYNLTPKDVAKLRRALNNKNLKFTITEVA